MHFQSSHVFSPENVLPSEPSKEIWMVLLGIHPLIIVGEFLFFSFIFIERNEDNGWRR